MLRADLLLRPTHEVGANWTDRGQAIEARGFHYGGAIKVISQLTGSERIVAAFIFLILICLGVAMAVAGRDDLIGTHGWIIALSAMAGVIALLRSYGAPDPLRPIVRIL